MLKQCILNKTPLRTSNNFGINDIKCDINSFALNTKSNIENITNENEKLDVKIDKEYSDILDSKIGLSFNKYYKVKIIVKENQKINKPIYIKYLFKDNDVLINNIELSFEKNSEASFIIKYESENNEINGINYLKQVNNVKENSKAKITFANLINDISDNYIAVENNIEENASLTYNFIDLGGKNKISNYYTKLLGYNSENKFNNLYFGTNKDMIDMNYHVEILGKKSVCNIEVQGAIDDESKKNFKGTIDFIEGASNSIGEENENCTILSDKAISKSLPMLLCHEENVQGAHGVSSGKIDEEKLFYIMSKGISEIDAKKLIVKANFNNVIQNIEDEELQNEIIEIIENKFRR